MANLVTVEANALLEASSGKTAYTLGTGPIKVALITTTTPSTASAAGSEVTGGPGPYTRQTVTFAAAAAGAIASNVPLTFAGMPAVTVGGVEEWDTAGTPVRRWFGLLTASKTTNSGDTFTIASGSYSKTLS